MAGRRRLTVLCGVFLAIAFVMGGAGAGVASAEECGAADVQTGDACGGLVAVSAQGNATTYCEPSFGFGCVAVAPTGNASNNVTSATGCGAFLVTSVGCVAVSGTGDASNTTGGNCAYAGVGVFAGCVAVSGTGSASNSVSGTCGAALIGVGVGCVAIGGGGDASNRVGPRGELSQCGFGSLGAGVGCVAVSNGGNASNTVESSDSVTGACAVGSTGAGFGCIAVSNGGDTSNDAATCETGEVAIGCRTQPGLVTRMVYAARFVSAPLRFATAIWSLF